MSADLQPDVDEVLQAEPTNDPAVKVKVEGPVRTQTLPRKAGATFTKAVGVGPQPQPILRADKRRAIARVMSDAAFLIAFDKSSQTDTSRMALWPSNTVFVTEAATEIWVQAKTSTANISIVTELWATGEMD